MPPRPGGVASAAIVSRVAVSRRPTSSVFCSAATSLLMRHCCAIDSSVFVSQYSTRPAGNHAIVTDMITGMNANTFACIGSVLGIGCSLNCANIAAPIRIGRMKNGSRELTDR